MPTDQQAIKGITLLTGVTDPDHQEEIVSLLHNGDGEEYGAQVIHWRVSQNSVKL